MDNKDSRNPVPEFKLQHLQKPYVEILQRRIGELRTCLGLGDKQSLAPMEVETLHMRVHNLMGSAAIFGHAAVGKAALRLDDMLNGSTVPWGSEELTSALYGLIKASEKALEAAITKHGDETPSFSEPAPAAISGAVLLTVDDDPAIHDLVGALLGYNTKIITAYNSDEAIEAACRYSPDLILLDDYMPGLSGLTLLERLRTNAAVPPAPVMMLTAEKRTHARMRAAAAGVVDYITKPFDPRLFTGKIYGFLNRFRMTVLVASENAVERQRLAKELRQQGLDVMEAADGAKVMALANSRVPELIILDECLGTDGNLILQMLHENNHTRSIPVLYLTVNRHSGKTRKEFGSGVIHYTVTPFVPAEIVARSLNILDLNARSKSSWFIESCNGHMAGG